MSPVDDYERPTIEDDEIDYLLGARQRLSRAPLARSDIVWTYSGVRPLYDDGSDDPSAVTRDYVLKVDALDGPPDGGRAPVLSIFGGKITTYRKLAEHALRRSRAVLPVDEGAVDRATRRCPAATCRARRPRRVGRDACARAIRSCQPMLLRALARRHGIARRRRARRREDARRTWARTSARELTAREIDYLVRARVGAHAPTTCCGGGPSAGCRCRAQRERVAQPWRARDA